MIEQEERYIHFVSSIENLNNAWRILKTIKKRKKNSLIGPAFQFALIEYSKPYTSSRGTFLRNHKLDESFISPTHVDLYRRILTLRNQILAHADLTIKDAKLYKTKTQSGKFVGIVQNVIFGTEELSRIDLIIELIEDTLKNMYIEEKRLESLLSFNS